MSRVLNLVLTHQSPAAIGRMLDWWHDCSLPNNLLVAFNGSEEAFAQIPHPHKIRIMDDRLVTTDHPRQRQSYTAIFREASRWLAGRDHTHVHFCEYDQIPLVPDLNSRQVARLEEERADVLAFQLGRVDGTNQPHYLYHKTLPGFAEHWTGFSIRPDKTAILSFFGTGSFWVRAAFDAVAATREPFPIYLELYLPTTAHHLGFRLRDWREQNGYINSLGNYIYAIDQARREGAWTIHPAKTLWNP